MKHRSLSFVVGIVLILAAAVFIWPQLSLFLASDSCMSSGGSFDFSRVQCDFQHGHPYVPFDLWPFWVAFAAAALGAGLVIRALLHLRSNKSAHA